MNRDFLRFIFCLNISGFDEIRNDFILLSQNFLLLNAIMKATHLLPTLLIFILLNWSCSQPVSPTSGDDAYISTVAENIEDCPVRVIKFHSTNCCKLCLTIERLVKETVMTEYREQIENGRLKLFVLNIDRSENREAAETYFAFGSALFVSSGFGDNILTSDITNDAFLYAETNPERFLETLRNTINQHLQ